MGYHARHPRLPSRSRQRCSRRSCRHSIDAREREGGLVRGAFSMRLTSSASQAQRHGARVKAAGAHMHLDSPSTAVHPIWASRRATSLFARRGWAPSRRPTFTPNCSARASKPWCSPAYYDQWRCAFHGSRGARPRLSGHRPVGRVRRSGCQGVNEFLLREIFSKTGDRGHDGGVLRSDFALASGAADTSCRALVIGGAESRTCEPSVQGPSEYSAVPEGVTHLVTVERAGAAATGNTSEGVDGEAGGGDGCPNGQGSRNSPVVHRQSERPPAAAERLQGPWPGPGQALAPRAPLQVHQCHGSRNTASNANARHGAQ